MAEAPPPIEEAAQPQPLPQNFVQYYTERDPLQGNYAGYLSPFSHEAEPQPTAPQLYETLTSFLPTEAGALVCLVGSGNEVGTVLLMHGLQRYSALPGAQGDPFDGRAFAFIGDVAGPNHEIDSVELGRDAFAWTRGPTNTRIPSTSARVRELWNEQPDAELLGPFANDDPMVRAIRTRHTIPVPAPYAARLIGRSLTPRQMWFEIAEAIIADGNEDPCGPLLDWITMIGTRPGEAQPSSVRRAFPVPLLRNERFIAQRHEVKKQFLPHLCAPPVASVVPGGVANFDGIRAVEALESVAQGLQNLPPAAAAKPSKTLKDTLTSAAYDRLLHIVGVTEEEDLPEYWLTLPTAGKQSRAALESALWNTSQDIGLEGKAPIVTPKLDREVKAVKFTASDSFDLTGAVQVFGLVLQDVGGDVDAWMARREEAERLAAAADILHDGEANPALVDAEKLQAQATVLLPTSYVLACTV